MTYAIVKGHPIPEKKRVKYPFPDMQIGDAFFVPLDEARRTRRAAFMYASRNGIGILTRKVGDQVGIWRTA